MNRLILAATVLGLLGLGAIGCTKTTSTERETTIKTPGGETTITIKKEVKEPDEKLTPKLP